MLAASRKGPNGKRNFAIVCLGAGCGLRLGELVHLRLGDLLREDAEIVVQGVTSKSKRSRKVTMHDEVAAALDAYIGEEREGAEAGDAALFLGRSGTPFRKEGLAAVFRSLAAAAGIADLSAHVSATPGRRTTCAPPRATSWTSTAKAAGSTSRTAC